MAAQAMAQPMRFLPSLIPGDATSTHWPAADPSIRAAASHFMLDGIGWDEAWAFSGKGAAAAH